VFSGPGSSDSPFKRVMDPQSEAHSENAPSSPLLQRSHVIAPDMLVDPGLCLLPRREFRSPIPFLRGAGVANFQSSGPCPRRRIRGGLLRPAGAQSLRTTCMYDMHAPPLADGDPPRAGLPRRALRFREGRDRPLLFIRFSRVNRLDPRGFCCSLVSALQIQSWPRLFPRFNASPRSQ